MTNQLKSSEIESLVALARAPSALKAAAEAHARDVIERRSLNEKIKALDAAAEIAWPAGQQAISAAIKKVRAAEIALRDSNAALAKANADSFNTSHAYTRERMAAEAILIAGADLPTIEAFKNECLNELNALGKPSVIVTWTVVARSEIDGKSIKSGASNMESIVSRMAAVRAAYHDVDLLKLEPDQRRLPSIIAEIRAIFPKVDNNPSQPTKV